MKGMMVLEVAAMVIIAVVVIFVVYNMYVASPSNVKPTIKYAKSECAYNNDCIGKSGGELCLEAGVPIPSVFCGCIDRDDCGGKACGAGNKCL